jgi:hypothetical protein
MNRKNAILWAFIVAFALPAFGWTQADAQAAPAGKTLKVKLNYTGAGIVDEQHKIYVLVLDSNPYTAKTLVDMTSQTAAAKNEATASTQSPEACHILRRETATAKDQTLTVSDLSASPVYVLAFYDKSGTYVVPDPPSGSPLGMYGKEPGKPEPIKLEKGKTVEVLLAFDDSTKTP